MLTALTRFLLGLHPAEPIPASMKADGRDMWTHVRKLRRNHERYVLQQARYKGYRWVGEANNWAVEKWEQIQRSWFEKAVGKGWVANKAVVDGKAEVDKGLRALGEAQKTSEKKIEALISLLDKNQIQSYMDMLEGN